MGPTTGLLLHFQYVEGSSTWEQDNAKPFVWIGRVYCLFGTPTCCVQFRHSFGLAKEMEVRPDKSLEISERIQATLDGMMFQARYQTF